MSLLTATESSARRAVLGTLVTAVDRSVAAGRVRPRHPAWVIAAGRSTVCSLPRQVQPRSMNEPWTPHLRLEEIGGRCRLTLQGVTCGEGATMQEAADDL